VCVPEGVGKESVEKTKHSGVALKSVWSYSTLQLCGVITVLFCRILSPLQGSFAKETYNFIDPTNQSRPI